MTERNKATNGEQTTGQLITLAKRHKFLLRGYMPACEWFSVYQNMAGEEGRHFAEKAIEYSERIQNMPTTGATDGQGEEAVVHLHYFRGGYDWYITEKDIDSDGEGQIQAFGLCCMYEDELGYVSIKELIAAGVELDLYWSPKTLKEVREERVERSKLPF